jgi:hypothetical protein
MTRPRFLLAIALVSLALAPVVARAEGRPAFRGMAGDRSVDVEQLGAKTRPIPSEQECAVLGGTPNVKLDCDSPLPNNEPDIEVDPTNPLHMVASSNDFDSCCDGFYTTFDGGNSWVQGNMSAEDRKRIGSDPVSVFDVKHGLVLHSSLNFKASGKDSDVVVSPSTDGGLTWHPPVVVADGSVNVFNDKEWIVTDNNPASPYYGRTYVTWSLFRSNDAGRYLESPIWESHSDDGGSTWSAPQEISGSHPSCTYQDDGPPGECDQDQGSVPTVGPDGTVHVVFWNEQNEASWEPGEVFEEQIMVVKSTDGGNSFLPPIPVEDMESGSLDYPTNVNDRRTLTGYQVRVNARGNIVAHPETGALYVVFADNRAGQHDGEGDPVTNTNVYLMVSTNGIDWDGPFVVSDAPSDQWFPWVEVNPADGALGIMYHDRSYDVDDGIGYGTTLATGTAGAFTYTKVHTVLSDPVHSAFFQAGVPGCEQCATFHGDYNNLSFGTDGRANVTWTDMRRILNRDLHAQYVFFARI